MVRSYVAGRRSRNQIFRFSSKAPSLEKNSVSVGKSPIISANNMDTEWIRIRFEVHGMDQDITPIVMALIAFCQEKAIKYFFGSLTLSIDKKHIPELEKLNTETFNNALEMKKSQTTNKDFIHESDWSAYSPALFAAALKNDLDRQSSEDFYDQFHALFVLTAIRKTFSIKKDNFDAIKEFCVRFAHKIEELSGLQVVVPKLSTDRTRAENSTEMMKAFVSIFSAYSTYCRNTGNVNRFYWDYTIDIDGDSKNDETKRQRNDS